MIAPATIVDAIQRRAGDARRFLVGLAGPPAAGKSTLAEVLRDGLIARGEMSIVGEDKGTAYVEQADQARHARSTQQYLAKLDVKHQQFFAVEQERLNQLALAEQQRQQALAAQQAAQQQQLAQQQQSQPTQ